MQPGNRACLDLFDTFAVDVQPRPRARPGRECCATTAVARLPEPSSQVGRRALLVCTPGRNACSVSAGNRGAAMSNRRPYGVTAAPPPQSAHRGFRRSHPQRQNGPPKDVLGDLNPYHTAPCHTTALNRQRTCFVESISRPHPDDAAVPGHQGRAPR